MKHYDAQDYCLSDFDFELPESLIAQLPAPSRTASRLLSVTGLGSYHDGYFPDMLSQLQKGDVLVLNNTKVIPARLFGQKRSGGKLEIFVERIQGEKIALCLVRSNHSPKIGSEISIAGEAAKVTGRKGVFFLIELVATTWDALLLRAGDIPLPPYISRESNRTDLERYQTVYAEQAGAVAAPTAGLHFDATLLQNVKAKGVQVVSVTLHVGAGTFQPVKTENLDDHQMHFELFEIPQETQKIINEAKDKGHKITAVGTTSLRALESAANNGRVTQLSGDTNLFIRPGFEFQIVNQLITNFHLPKSSLMMLVSAFSGYDEIKLAYQHAIKQTYRFFSYGDAMFLKQKLK